MALFRDITSVDTDWLRHYESSLVEDATGENIDIPKKIILAHQELSGRLDGFLRSQEAGSLDQVVVTDLLRESWSYLALALMYRDAHSSHLSDRFERNWKTFADRAEKALNLLFETGIGMVYEPMPVAVPPVVHLERGDAGAGMFLVQVAYVSNSGQEGAPSSAKAIEIGDNQRPTVYLSGYPANAAGWNLYMGLTKDSLGRQNSAVLPLSSSWTLYGPGLQPGPAPLGGQRPDFFVRRRRLILRG